MAPDSFYWIQSLELVIVENKKASLRSLLFQEEVITPGHGSMVQRLRPVSLDR